MACYANTLGAKLTPRKVAYRVKVLNQSQE